MFRCPSLFAAAAISLAASCARPPDSPLRVVPRVGQKVSIRDPATGERLQGNVIAISGDSLTVERGGESVRLSTELLRDGKVATSKTSGAGKGTAIGMGIGSAVGLIAGVIAVSNSDCTGSLCGLETLAVPGYAMLGAAGGALIGGIAGATTRVPFWSPATAPGLVTAQFEKDLVTGDMVRLIGRTEVGTVVGGGGRAAFVRFPSGADTLVDLAGMERYTGERPNVTKAMRYGAAVGAGLAIVSYLAENDELYTQPTAAEVVAGTVLMASVGAGVGAMVTKSSSHIWTAVGTSPAKTYSIVPVLGWGRVGVLARLAW